MVKKIPFLLIYARILIGLIIGFIAFWDMKSKEFTIVALMILALLTDVFDGIIARKLNVSSERLRIWDSNVDLFFWLITIFSIFYLNFNFVKGNFFWIGIILILELFSYFVSFLKFKKTIATHSILAKFWTLTLLVFLIDLCLSHSSEIPFAICIGLGIISRIEIILIILKLDKWATDVPSIFAVTKINKGVPVRKFKLFNS